MAKGKKQQVIKNLRQTYLALRAIKASLINQGMDPRDVEYEESVVNLKHTFFEVHVACMEAGVDPIPICINLGKTPPKRKR